MNNKPVLNKITVPKSNVTVKHQKTNHVLVIDCSGSMSYDLPKIRTQLKNKIPTMVSEGDKVSLVWFSGKGQYGTLAEKVEINSLTDLGYLNTAIDRWLKPVGMTGFVEPLQSACALAGTCDDEPVSLFFLTDGCDNQWDTSLILKTASQTGACVQNTVIVEYGWNCNRSLLTKMAEAMEGTLVFCEDFDKYDPVMDSVLKKSLSSIKKVTLDVKNPYQGIVFSVTENGPVTYNIKNNQIEVPQTVDCVYFYGNDLSNDFFDKEIKAVLQSVVLFSRNMDSGFVKRILARLEYVELFNKFSTSFGKQNITDFQSRCIEISNNLAILSEYEKSKDIKVDPNAFTVLDLLFMLSSDKGNLIHVDDMKYKKIGRSREAVEDTLSDDEIKNLQQELGKAKSKADIEALASKMNQIIESKKDALKFEAYPSGGYPISNLVWNEFRPNVSILIKKNGFVTLGKDATSLGLPEKFDTFIYRNFTIIVDGIVNVDSLPVTITSDTENAISSKWKAFKGLKKDKDGKYNIPIRTLPTLNESMVTGVSAKQFVELNYLKCLCKANEKLAKSFREKWFGKRTSESFTKSYTVEANEWLKANGITDYSGFGPKVKVAEKSGDFYMSVELYSEIPGLSKVPSVNEFLKALESLKKSGKKLSIANELFVQGYNGLVQHEGSDDKVKDGLLSGIDTLNDKAMSDLNTSLTKMMFSIVVGQTWFKEFASLSENEIEVELNGEPVKCKVQLKDVQVDL